VVDPWISARSLRVRRNAERALMTTKERRARKRRGRSSGSPGIHGDGLAVASADDAEEPDDRRRSGGSGKRVEQPPHRKEISRRGGASEDQPTRTGSRCWNGENIPANIYGGTRKFGGQSRSE